MPSRASCTEGGVRCPHAPQFAGPMQPRQRNRISPVRFDPLARPFRDQSRSDHHAFVAERLDLPIKPVSRRPGFKTNMQPIVSARQSLDRSLDRQRAVLNVAEKPDFSRPAPFRDRNGVLLLGDVESHESFAILSHGPPTKLCAILSAPARPRLTIFVARGGTIILNPDEEVQARLNLVVAKFRESQSARSVMGFLRTSGLPLPVRPVLGPSPHDVVWCDADSARVRGVLQNPAYAGAYVYGRRQKDASQCRRGSVGGTVKVAIADWAVCLKAAHPGYIGWEEFMANQRRLADNANRYEAGHTGVPRKGSALLQGIAICGRCGRHMSLRYTGPNGDYPVYCCRFDRDQRGGALCQEVRALPVDALVERLLLDALVPDQIAIAIAAMGQLEEESRQLERQWTLRRERARYGAERARRQYDAVEPENRLVARSLERT